MMMMIIKSASLTSLACIAIFFDVTTAESFLSDVTTGGGGGLRQRSLVALNIQGIGPCTKDQPCGRCEGDCHRDEDCAGNLVCYNVAGRHKPGDFCAKIPGCSGEDLSKTDWCIRPEDMPVPNLCDTRSEVESHNGNDKTDPPNVEIASCEEYESLLFDLTTKINDVDAETLRFQILTDELARTANLADPSATERRFLIATKTNAVLTDGESGLQKLSQQQQRLADGNGKVTEINAAIRDFVGVWRDENGVLHGRVNDLASENALLQAERDDLNVQIANLNANVNELQSLVNQQGGLNDELDDSVSSLEAEIDRLKAENLRYQELNQDFEERIQFLQNQVGSLKAENEEFSRLNDILEAAHDRLEGQVTNLTNQNDILETSVDELESAVDRLANETSRLKIVNDELEQNVGRLEEEVDTLETNVDRLEGLNSQLETIVSFVNETSIGINESYEQVTAFLAEQINVNRLLNQELLQNNYKQRVELWDCAYLETFGDYDFAFNENLEIPDQGIDSEESVFNMVIDYVNSRVLDELCLDIVKFEEYLETNFDYPIYTSKHIKAGISLYTDMVFDYYFPNGDQVGLTPEDWAEAGFDCKNLPNDKIFSQ